MNALAITAPTGSPFFTGRRPALVRQRVRPAVVTPLVAVRPDVVALLPLVRKIASWFERRYSLPAGWDHDDLVSEGVIGLLRAVAKYDPTRPCSVETYAGYWIRGLLWKALKARWTELNHEAPPPDDEMEGPWPPPEKAVLYREVIDIVDRLEVAERVLVYGRVDNETLSALARQLGMPISTANRWHLRALRRARRAAGVMYDPEPAAA